jgi:hypothetical protein
MRVLGKNSLYGTRIKGKQVLKIVFNATVAFCYFTSVSSTKIVTIIIDMVHCEFPGTSSNHYSHQLCAECFCVSLFKPLNNGPFCFSFRFS